MFGDAKNHAEARPRTAKPEAAAQTEHASQTEERAEMMTSLPDVCPNCGSTEREMEPFIDENGTLTNLMTAICTGCGYRLGDIPSLLPGAEAEEAEKSLEIVPPREPEE